MLLWRHESNHMRLSVPNRTPTTTPAFEKVVNDPGCSWSWMDLYRDTIDFEWHRHPEYELTLTTNSNGHRLAGDSIEAYGDNDLVLIGPDVPHTWQSKNTIDPSRPHHTCVVKFSAEWVDQLTALFPELHRLTPLMREARRGVAFSTQVATGIRADFESLGQLPGDQRLVVLLGILRRLSTDDDYRALNPGPAPACSQLQDPRLDRVFVWLHSHYSERVQVPVLADLACLSVSAFHRLFLRTTRVSPLVYVSRLRIGRACALLIEGRLKIAAIANEVGYESLAQFNKEFRRHKGMPPRAFVAR
jgi:AraC-like DNA-binding protein